MSISENLRGRSRLSMPGIALHFRASNEFSSQKDAVMFDQKLIGSADAIFEEHMEAELADDLDKTLATMSANPYIVNVPETRIPRCPRRIRQRVCS